MIETSHERKTPAVPTIDLDLLPVIRPGVIFVRALRDSLPSILAWGVGYSVLIVTVVILYPILQDKNTLVSVLNGLGLFEVAADNFNGSVGDIGSFAGYLAFEALGWGPTVLAIFTATQAIGAIMGEERQGTLELLLSTPITRKRLITEKILAIVVSLIGVLLIMWASLVVSTRLFGDVDFAIRQANAGVWHILPISLVILSFTLAMSVTFRSPRLVGGLTALFITVSFFVRSLADSTDTSLLEFLSRFSVYNYYSSIGAMTQGVRWGTDLSLIGVSVAIFGLAMIRFQRRDLGV
jgi:ABC-2 type transport system permease protein